MCYKLHRLVFPYSLLQRLFVDSNRNLLENYDLNPQKVVVEVNMEILDDEVYSTYLLKNEDTVEVISFVGGG